MDLGCYVLNAARQVGRWLGEAPSVVSARPRLRAPTLTLPCESSSPTQIESTGNCIGI